jgi:peptidoglycan-N-acetylglucosamine deacetylase
MSAEPLRRVAFTFDDLPGVNAGCEIKPVEEMNRKLIAAIKRADMPATALVVESNLCARLRSNIGRIYEMWLTAGLDLGNHTYSHQNFNETPLEKYEKDVIEGERTLRPLLAARGKKLRYFRYPYLRSGTELGKKRAFEKFLERRGYVNAPVTIDNDEWIYAAAYRSALARGDRPTAARLADDYVRYMDDMFGFYETLSRETLGYELPQVLLLHVNQLNADHLDRLVVMAKKRGYEFISLDEALRDKAYAQKDRYVGNRGFSWLHRWAIDKGKNPPMHPDPPDWVMELYRAR